MFFKIESWNFQVQFEIKIRETSQNFHSFSLFRQLLFSSFFISCLIELKFCKVSWNSISKWTWKFQLSILKNKKVLLLKKNFFKPLSISKQKNFVYWLNFKEGFAVTMLEYLLLFPISDMIIWERLYYQSGYWWTIFNSKPLKS